MTAVPAIRRPSESEGTVRQLSGTDTTMLVAERPHAPNHVAPINVYDQSTAPGGVVTFRQVLRRVEDRLHVAPVLRQRLRNVPFGLDRPYWVDDPDFDLEFHVRHIGLPKPGDWRQFCILAARLAARPLDLSRPPWEMWVIEGLDAVEDVPPGAFAVMIKLHHAAMDGTATNLLNIALHDGKEEVPPPAEAVTGSGDGEPPTARLLGRAALHSLVRPVEFARMASAHVPTLPRRLGGVLRQPRLPAGMPAATRFNRLLSPHRVWFARWYPFDEVRAMRKLVPGATVNDVALTIVAGTLRRYLDEKGELPASSLLATVPVSLRPSGAGEAAGNQFALMSLPFGTHIDDPVERLTFVQQTTSAAKESRAASDAPSAMQMAELLPATVQSLLGRTMIGGMSRIGRTPAHTVVTNVPGATEEMTFCGARLLLPVGVAPIVDGMGLMHCISSYAGRQLTVMVTADRDAMPDPDRYVECLDDSYTELAKAAG